MLQGQCPRLRHIVSGTFNTPFLHLLAFDTLTRTLSLLSTLPGYGPHSFLTAGRTSSLAPNQLVDLVYATTWSEEEKALCAWRVHWPIAKVEEPKLEWLGNVPITATSSYVHVQPPPYHCLTAPGYGVQPGPSQHLYSAGGPTGELHTIHSETGTIVSKQQELVFLRNGVKDLPHADKSRKALRYGAHNVDVGKGNLAYIADVGRNEILVYSRDSHTGRLDFVSSVSMPGGKEDGPRHVVPSPCGRWVYSVTEHTSYVDVWRMDGNTAQLSHALRVSVLPSEREAALHEYRGDTVRLSPDGLSLFATTRGKNKGTKGYVTAWRIQQTQDEVHLQRVVTYETRNSGGKANAIEFAPRYETDAQQEVSLTAFDYAVLTDDEQGFVTVLEWDGHDLRDAATIQLPVLDSGDPQGASQAIWLS